jgi:ComEC/Rec2-related protein
MNNLSYFWLWLLLSVITITGFWHVWFFVLILSTLTLILLVKNKSSRHGLVCLWLWSTVGTLSVGYSLISNNFSTILIQKWESVIVQVNQKIKNDTMSAYLLSWWTVTTTQVLIQWDTLEYRPWDFTTVIVDDITFAWYPSIARSQNLIRYPSTFEYSRWLAMKWYYWHIRSNAHAEYPPYRSFTKSSVSRTTKVNSFVQSYIQQKYSRNTAWLLQWMILWWREWLTQQEYDSFIQSWLVHIIAVSWSNIMMVVVLLSFLLFWVPLYVRTPLIILGILMYSVVVWLDSSVQRALVMWSTVLVAILVWRRISIWRVLWYACIALTMRNPWSVLYDLGFLLSFWALVGILLLVRLVSNRPVHSFFTSYIFPSIWATLWVLPVLVVAMGWINILSPFINILVVPFVPLILLLWTLWVVVPFPFIRIVEYMTWVFFDLSLRAAEHAIMLEVSTALSKLVFVVMLIVLYIVCVLVLQHTKAPVLRA